MTPRHNTRYIFDDILAPNKIDNWSRNFLTRFSVRHFRRQLLMAHNYNVVFIYKITAQKLLSIISHLFQNWNKIQAEKRKKFASDAIIESLCRNSSSKYGICIKRFSASSDHGKMIIQYESLNRIKITRSASRISLFAGQHFWRDLFVLRIHVGVGDN